jgi:hypothetical protein
MTPSVQRSIAAFATAWAIRALASCDVHVPLAVDDAAVPPGRPGSGMGSGPTGTGSGSNGAGSGSGTVIGGPDPPLPVPVAELASGLDLPSQIALDDDFVYWLNQGASRPPSVMRVAKAGGEPRPLATEPRFPVSLAVDDHAVYWTASGSNAGEGAVMRVDKTGGTPVALATGLNWPGGLAQDGDSLYWRDEFVGVKRVAKQGGPVSMVAAGLTLGPAVAVDQDRVYFQDEAGTLLAVPKTGGAVVVIAAVPRIRILFLVVDRGVAYWHLDGIAPLMQVSTAGGTPNVLFPSDDELTSFALTDDALYVAQMGEPLALGPPGPRSIHRVTRDGAGNTQVTPPRAGNWGLAVDARRVYWTNLSAGTLSAVDR